MKSIVEVVYKNAKTNPCSLMVADGYGTEYTYEKAVEVITRFSSKLEQILGKKSGKRVMAECRQNCEFLLLSLACELSGAVFVPIEAGASNDRKNDIAKETNSSLWIGQGDAPERMRSLTFEELVTGEETGIERGVDALAFPGGNELAEVLYTTGTTGKSKGIMISNKANVALAENILHGVCMKKGNVEFIPLPISHSHGLRCCYANMLNGGTIVLMDGLLNIKKAFSLIDKFSVTSMDLSPAATSMIIKLSKGTFWNYANQLDYIQIGTAPLSETLKNEMIDNLPNVRLYNFYGSTEAGRSCVLEFSKESGKNNCIGKPTKNSRIVFTDENRNITEATKEKPGLLATYGNMNMLGYLNNEDLTATTMNDGYVFSNDLGYMDQDGYVYVIGRVDDVITYNGIKIAPDEIEGIATSYAEIMDACCVPVTDKVYGQIPKLFISINKSIEYDQNGFLEYLKEHIDSNKVPKQIEVIDEIPRTYNGKLLRRELVEQKG